MVEFNAVTTLIEDILLETDVVVLMVVLKINERILVLELVLDKSELTDMFEVDVVILVFTFYMIKKMKYNI